MRRLLLCLAAAAMVVAGLAAPAAGQTAPPITITSVSPPCAPISRSTTVTVSGTAGAGWQGYARVYATDGKTVLDGTEWAADRVGNWSAQLSFPPTVNGYYLIEVGDGNMTARAWFSAPCRNPRVVLEPDCSRPGQATALTVRAFDFAPNDAGYIYYDYSGPNSFGDDRIRIPTDGAGNFSTDKSPDGPFSVTPPDRDVPIRVTDQGDKTVLNVRWLRCPPPGVTTSTTEVPFTPDPTPDEPVTVPTVTITLPDRPGTPVTTMPVTIPPVTPGATLTLLPEVGPPGFVALATGTGFAPGPVELAWTPGIGRTTAVAGPDGTFATRVMVFPRDRLGPRTLVATGGGVAAIDSFLVVPPTVQPSGTSVAQITRIRRFAQR